MANEKRLIDANALLEDFGEEPMVWNDGEAEIQERSDWQKYRVLVELQPTVDAVEVVHGYWKEWWCDEYITYFHKCSVCGWDALTKEETAHDEVLSNYCPNCGAKMDGERKDNG